MVRISAQKSGPCTPGHAYKKRLPGIILENRDWNGFVFCDLVYPVWWTGMGTKTCQRSRMQKCGYPREKTAKGEGRSW